MTAFDDMECGDHCTIADDEDIEMTLSALLTAHAATDRLGPEDTDEWGPGVDAEDE